ncbi:MAG: heat shock protein HspQ [Rhodospirillales bacterium]|nr:heat shock protein HspQ [Rhodospirillales bacterium]MCW8861304.1 heat shock protein HspQ [Rhodospirillales bacterium]
MHGERPKRPDVRTPIASGDAAFHVGQLVHHTLFGYRGVIVDVDPYFNGSEEWYKDHAKSRPSKERPWYHVLVDEADYRTYVAERNLEPDETGTPVRHPDVPFLLGHFSGDSYAPRTKGN